MKQEELLRKIYWISAVLISVILTFLASVVFLNPSSVGNPRFVWNINLWAVAWALNFVIILVLSFILSRNLIKLFFEYQANRPGSRIKTKLVITLSAFSLFPALIMAFLAFGLINQNLRQWFSSPAEQLLESSQSIARSYYEQTRLFRLATTRFLAQEVAISRSEPTDQFENVRREYGFDGFVLFNSQNERVFAEGEWPQGEPLEASIQQVLGGEEYYRLERRIDQDS